MTYNSGREAIFYARRAILHSALTEILLMRRFCCEVRKEHMPANSRVLPAAWALV